MPTLTGKPYRLLIGGSWVEGGGGAYGVVNPATEAIIDEAPEASVADAEDAARAARDALPAWKRTSAEERARPARAPSPTRSGSATTTCCR